MWLCGLYYGELYVLKSSRALLSSCFVIPFSIVVTSFREEGVGLCASRAFVIICLFVLYVFGFCHVSLPLGVGMWLRFVIVALPGSSINVFCLALFSCFELVL